MILVIGLRKQNNAGTMRTLEGTLEVSVFPEKNSAGDYEDEGDDTPFKK